jgi:hypothetical protein
MSKPVGELTIEPEPSPGGEPINYARLFRHDLLLEPRIVSTRVALAQVATLHLFKDEDSYSIEADVADHIAAQYRTLDLSKRSSLEFKVKDGMAHSAQLLTGDIMTHDEFFDETSAIMNHQPLLFEPFEKSMLIGKWRSRYQLHFEATEVSSPEQRLILIGGLAAFINFMNEESQKAR